MKHPDFRRGWVSRGPVVVFWVDDSMVNPRARSPPGDILVVGAPKPREDRVIVVVGDVAFADTVARDAVTRRS